jgi:hypothetical protein
VEAVDGALNASDLLLNLQITARSLLQVAIGKGSLGDEHPKAAFVERRLLGIEPISQAIELGARSSYLFGKAG